MHPQTETRPDAPSDPADCAIGPTVIGAPGELIDLPQRRLPVGADLATQIGDLLSISELTRALCMPEASASPIQPTLEPVRNQTEEEPATVCAFFEPALPESPVPAPAAPPRTPSRPAPSPFRAAAPAASRVATPPAPATPRIPPRSPAPPSDLPLVLPADAEMTMIPQIAYHARPEPLARPRPEPTEIERLPSPLPRARIIERRRGIEEVTPQRYIATQVTMKPETVVSIRSLTHLRSGQKVPSLGLVPIIAAVFAILGVAAGVILF